MCDHLDRELWLTLSNTKAELSGVRQDLADTTKTLDKYREMHVKMSRANSELRKALDKYREMHVKMSRSNSELRKSVADMNEALAACTGERDLARELFQGMVSEYADLLDRYSKMCDDYGVEGSRYVAGHGKF